LNGLNKIAVAAIMIFAGCAPQMQKPVQNCPGWKSMSEALAAGRVRSRDVLPVKASGDCHLRYYAEGKKYDENFPVKVWINPPDKIYLQGDVAFNPKGVILGSNENEFWLSVRLKEVDSYWWGRWDEQDGGEMFAINPKMLLEAIGITDIGDEQSWSLSNEAGLSVLTERNGQNSIIKKIYVSNCAFLISRIEYFDANGRAAVVVEVNNYEKVSDNFSVPTSIKISHQPEKKSEDWASVTLNLKSVKGANLTEEQRRILFTRPEPEGFKHVYKISER